MNLFLFAGWVVSACAIFFVFVFPSSIHCGAKTRIGGGDLEISKSILDFFIGIGWQSAVILGDSMEIIVCSISEDEVHDFIDIKTGELSLDFKRQYLTILRSLHECGSASWRSGNKIGAKVFYADIMANRMTLIRCLNES